MNEPKLVAIDLGAESCRLSLLRWTQGKPQITLVHRFPNRPIEEHGSLRWDIEAIYRGVLEGLLRCAEVANDRIEAIGVDGWAVDYVRLNGSGHAIGNPFCYRDERTVEAEREVCRRIPRERLYALTGIQFLRFNTVYQLFADSKQKIDQSFKWLNLPEYLTYRLGGDAVAEMTNATHSQMVQLGTQEWCREIFESLDLDFAAAPDIVPTGSIVGKVTCALGRIDAFRETKLIVPACHDTASAVAGIPAEGDRWAFISSGTWSLVGVTLEAPVATEAARLKNFTNLGGADGKICFLKNVNGMWLLQQCLEHWRGRGHLLSVAEVIDYCGRSGEPEYLLDVDDPELLLPGNMPAKINTQFQRAGLPPVSRNENDVVAFANIILHSLAARYAEVLKDIQDITGKKLSRLYVVGGGSKNTVLNRLTAERTGMEVVPGPAESATIGNFAVQLSTLGTDYTDRSAVRGRSTANWASILVPSDSRLFVEKSQVV